MAQPNLAAGGERLDYDPVWMNFGTRNIHLRELTAHFNGLFKGSLDNGAQAGGAGGEGSSKIARSATYDNQLKWIFGTILKSA